MAWVAVEGPEEWQIPTQLEGLIKGNVCFWHYISTQIPCMYCSQLSRCPARECQSWTAVMQYNNSIIPCVCELVLFVVVCLLPRQTDHTLKEFDTNSDPWYVNRIVDIFCQNAQFSASVVTAFPNLSLLKNMAPVTSLSLSLNTISCDCQVRSLDLQIPCKTFRSPVVWQPRKVFYSNVWSFFCAQLVLSSWLSL